MNKDQANSTRILDKAREIIRQAELNRNTYSSTMFIADCCVFIGGNMEPLENKSFSEELPAVLVELFYSDNKTEFEKYVSQLKKGLRFSGIARENVLRIVSTAMQKLPESISPFYLLQLLSLSTQFMRVESKTCSGLGTAFSQMKMVVLRLLFGEDWKKTIPFLEILAQIQQGILDKTPQFVDQKDHCSSSKK